MNDPLLPPPGQPQDPLEQALRDSLANVSSHGVRPSLVDVQQRARRRQGRRAATMVGAMIVLVVGAGTVLATRHDRTPLAITAGDGSTIAPPYTTIACMEVMPTTVPAFDPTLTTNVDFGLTTTTADLRTVVASFVPGESTTTTDPTGTALYVPVPGLCQPTPASQWRCQGPLATTSDGWTIYQYCEPLYVNPPATTEPPTTDPGIPARDTLIPTTAEFVSTTIPTP